MPRVTQPRVIPPQRTLPRGTLVIVRLDPAVGHEQAGTRPAIILSKDAFNESRMGLITIAPLTTRERQYETRVAVTAPEAGLKQDSWVICEQTRTISKLRIVETLERVRPDTLSKVEAIVRRLLFPL